MNSAWSSSLMGPMFSPSGQRTGYPYHSGMAHFWVHIMLDTLHLHQMKHLILGTIIMKGFGSLLFIFGSSLGAVILLIAAPILYDFYNYDAGHKEFSLLFVKFSQSLALIWHCCFSLA